MNTRDSYFPHAVFGANANPPRVLISPQRYIQGPGVIDQVGTYLSLVPASRAAILISQRGQRADGLRLVDSLKRSAIDYSIHTFNGECSIDEIDLHAGDLVDQGVDCLIAVGGGKCVDAGKCIAWRLDVPVVVVPTLASNDAPCSALSVLYTPQGVMSGVEFFPQNPALVVVDTAIVADAPERYLVAGMGDAMATWYEARTCIANPNATTTIGARPTLAACAMGEVCAATLFSEGLAAAEAVTARRVDESLEKVVEANTLLSGIGFESGGLALAHAIAQSYTAVPVVHANHLHGEMVAMGTLAQLVLESQQEAKRVAEFFVRVGLPVHLGQLSLAPDDRAAMETVVEVTMAFPSAHNMPMPMTREVIRDAIARAHELGLAVTGSSGDAAWRRLHG